MCFTITFQVCHIIFSWSKLYTERFRFLELNKITLDYLYYLDFFYFFLISVVLLQAKLYKFRPNAEIVYTVP